jgi:hypothetical protein
VCDGAATHNAVSRILPDSASLVLMIIPPKTHAMTMPAMMIIPPKTRAMTMPAMMIIPQKLTP